MAAQFVSLENGIPSHDRIGRVLARDFSMMIQSVGMTSASIFILSHKDICANVDSLANEASILQVTALRGDKRHSNPADCQ